MFFISISPNRFNGNLGSEIFEASRTCFEHRYRQRRATAGDKRIFTHFFFESTAAAAQHKINLQTSALSWLFFFPRSIIIVIQPSIESLLACIDASALSFCFVGRVGRSYYYLVRHKRQLKYVWWWVRAPNNAREKQNRAEKLRRHEKSDVKHMEISCANPSDMFNSIKTKSRGTSSPVAASGKFTVHNILNECIVLEFITIRCTMSNKGHNITDYLALRRMPPRQRNLSLSRLPLTAFFPQYLSKAFWTGRQRPPSNGINGMLSALSIRHHDKLNKRNEKKKRRIVASMQMWF